MQKLLQNNIKDTKSQVKNIELIQEEEKKEVNMTL